MTTTPHIEFIEVDNDIQKRMDAIVSLWNDKKTIWK
ncbi:MAG: hypothetical protein ACD_71C00154G0006 [uncultured bacterium (gcode 4)]|uniref:Uncharacterized protein n=1 Tax=uncultured bacterium (gcode 4) TaxID=1234023 RepID=K2A2Y8_9BACT|nr:MAG: hypothetical protein ACD_71C00154G0006 [uncultured bacterium (gcode 4)]